MDDQDKKSIEEVWICMLDARKLLQQQNIILEE